MMRKKSGTQLCPNINHFDTACTYTFGILTISNFLSYILANIKVINKNLCAVYDVTSMLVLNIVEHISIEDVFEYPDICMPIKLN